MKQRLITAGLALLMLALLALSRPAAEAVRQGLQLCAGSVIPALFPFLVLSSLFAAVGGTSGAGRGFSASAQRVLRCSSRGVSVFFLGILGGYPVGGRLVGQLLRAKELSREEAEHLLCFCNNAGPAFILGIAGLGCFGSLRIGIWLYLIHVGAAFLLGLLSGRKPSTPTSPRPITSAAGPRPSFPQSLVESIGAAGSTMVQICAFVVFFFTLLQLFSSLTGLSHPLLLGSVELTQGILRLPDSGVGLIMAAALLGWGGVSVHCQTAAVLSGTGLSLRRYLCAKALHAALSALFALPAAHFLFQA